MQNYERLRKEVLEENLNHPECPLTKQEIEWVRKKMKEQQIKNSLKGLLSKSFRVFKR